MMKRMTKAIALSLALLLCLCLAACGGSGKYAYDEEDEYAMAQEAPGRAAYDSAAEAVAPNGFAGDMALKSGGTGTPAGGGSVYTRADVKLIRRAWLTVESTDFDASLAELNKQVAKFDGYFESSEVYTGGYYAAQGDCRTGNYTVRIPAQAYDAFMASLDGLGTVTHRNESSEDVGQQYHDIESRLKTQRIKQERLQALLEKAEDMEDIISLENALSDVEYMIENYGSDLRRYDGLIDYATVNISLEEVLRVSAAPGERQPLLERMGAGIASSARDFVDGIQEFLIWLSYNLVGILIFAAVVVVCVVLIKRAVRRAKKTSPAQAPAPAAPQPEPEKKD